MLSIVYITRINFWSKKAHAINTLKTCEAISCRTDVDLLLLTTEPSQSSLTEMLQANGVTKPFPLRFLNTKATKIKYHPLVVCRLISLILDNWAVIFYLFRQKGQIDVIYSRDHLLWPALWFSKFMLNKKVFFESHYVLSKKISQRLVDYCVRLADGVVAIAHALTTHYQKLNSNIITVFCAAAEPETFANRPNKDELRKILALPSDKILLVYTGNLYRTGNNDSYGIEDLIKSLPLLPNCLFVGVGKRDLTNYSLEEYAMKLKVKDQVMILPWVTKDRVADFILAADILIIPASGNRPGNSPTKVFEYLAAGRPIVAARTVAIAEVLVDGSNALLVDYENPKSWAEAINKVIHDKILAKKISDRACQDAQLYSWDKRAEKIVNFIAC